MTSIKLTAQQIQQVCDENCNEPIDPPIDPPPVDPPPVEPPPEPPQAGVQNTTFEAIFGESLYFDQPNPKVFSQEDFKIYEKILCMAIQLPRILSPSRLTMQKSSSSTPSNGTREAQFSFAGDLDHPEASQNWGNTSLNLDLDPGDSNRMLYFYVEFKGDAGTWGLKIQPYALGVKA